ncbi:Lipoxygenase y domain-containing protein 1 [Cichlidogyrus casuarinus]|uniref:Lipoxygenase y domain-containing protein 1 n=1 Tax=Cichlidogyrus casuarinus TaxID=1844966 RepID=A0ABD2PSE9_9PLAT
MVLTGDKSGSGTNANVFITLFSGSKSGLNSGQMQLKQKGKNLFERGQVDVFEVESVDLGDVDKIRIEHDNSGLFSDWYLAQVQVTNLETNKQWSFPCNQWLSKMKGDGKTWKDISAV